MSKLTRKQFIERLAPYAIADMMITEVPASLTIAQGILESADGNSGLAVKANNLFGIKGKGSAGSVAMPTTEYVNGKPVSVVAQFRKYNNWGESVADHSELFQNGVSWNRNLYREVIGKDGITAAKEVAKAGYATDPQYASKLIKIIQDNNLLQYDNQSKPKPSDSELDRIKLLEDKVRVIIDELTRLSDRLTEVPAPEWFMEEFPNILDLINPETGKPLLSRKTGTNDFWRSFAITLRIVKWNHNYFS